MRQISCQTNCYLLITNYVLQSANCTFKPRWKSQPLVSSLSLEFSLVVLKCCFFNLSSDKVLKSWTARITQLGERIDFSKE